MRKTSGWWLAARATTLLGLERDVARTHGASNQHASWGARRTVPPCWLARLLRSDRVYVVYNHVLLYATPSNVCCRPMLLCSLILASLPMLPPSIDH